jgi:hypothetical protein
MLLLLSWSAPNYYGVLTAKLYDYLSAGRPILALVNGPDDPELRQIVEGTRAGKVFATRDSVAAWLLDGYLKWRDHDQRLEWRPDLTAMTAYLESLPLATPYPRGA